VTVTVTKGLVKNSKTCQIAFCKMLRNETAPNERTALIVAFVVMVALWRLISFIETRWWDGWSLGLYWDSTNWCNHGFFLWSFLFSGGKTVRRFLMASRLEALTCAGIWNYIQNREDDDDTESESKQWVLLRVGLVDGPGKRASPWQFCFDLSCSIHGFSILPELLFLNVGLTDNYL